jgi:enediyne biosynthesis protein E4
VRICSPALLFSLSPLLLVGCNGKPTPPTPPVQPAQATSTATTTEELPLNAKFTDMTRAAGLDFIQSDGSCGMRYFVEQVAAGATVFDANGDGYPDIYFPAPKGIGECSAMPNLKNLRQRLYLNNGKGKFTLQANAFDTETPYGISGVAGDYNNDGKIDLYVACYDRNVLYRNNGNGTFTDVTKKAGVAVGGFSTGGTWFDYDGDGRLDLYVLRYCEWTVDSDIVCPGPDGKRDACHPNTYTPARNVLFHNNGDGTFTDVTEKSHAAPEKRRSLSACAFDFDGDGKLDLFVANDLGPNYLLRNNGDGTFEDVANQQNVALGETGQNQANMGSAITDYDADGDWDVIVTTFANEPYTLYQNDGGYFTDVSGLTGVAEATRPYLGFGVLFLDTRNSGAMDLFFANGHVFPSVAKTTPTITYKQPNQLLLRTNKNTYIDAKDALPKDDVRVHRGACSGDFDGDGRMDILATATNDLPSLLHNESPQANWLTIRCVNKYGCATPIGTRGLATVGGKKLHRQIMGGGSYAGDSDFVMHFGLGNAAQIDSLEIKWLSGKTQTLTNVKANQVLKISE